MNVYVRKRDLAKYVPIKIVQLMKTIGKIIRSIIETILLKC